MNDVIPFPRPLSCVPEGTEATTATNELEPEEIPQEIPQACSSDHVRDTIGVVESFMRHGREALDAAQKAIDEASETIGVAARSRALNPTRFICRSEVRSFLLEYASANRSHRFSRVSEETLTEINEQVRLLLIARVRRLPSKGKTI